MNIRIIGKIAEKYPVLGRFLEYFTYGAGATFATGVAFALRDYAMTGNLTEFSLSLEAVIVSLTMTLLGARRKSQSDKK